MKIMGRRAYPKEMSANIFFKRERKLNMTNRGHEKPQQLMNILCWVINHARVRPLAAQQSDVVQCKHWKKTNV